jgi:PAS domain S-box-containing protein
VDRLKWKEDSLIESVRGRITELQRQAAQLPGEHRMLAVAAEDLQNTLEDLGVAEAELRQQNDELAAAREAVEAERHRYQELFELAPDAYLVTDPAGVILEANRAAATLLNVSQPFLIGKPLFLFVAAEERCASPAELHRLGEVAGISEWELQLQPRDGTPLNAAVSVAAVRDPEGKLAALRWLVRDISARKQMEAALRRHAEELERADRAKDQFLAMLAHELRNPIGTISSAVNLLKLLGRSDPRLVRPREIIERQVSHTTRLLDDLLNVSRIARGKITLHRIRLDLARLVRDTCADFRSEAEAAGLTLSLEMPEEPLWMDGDPTRLAQAVGNLIHNAIKFTEQGGHITLRLALEPEGRRGAITVRDTGIGIEPEVLPHVFETFAQADRSLERSRGGLGLGLALVRGLVELHGGEVRAASEGAGCGAEFSLLLPLAPTSVVSDGVTSAAPAGSGSMRILIAEDNEDAAESLCTVLELFGCRVEVAHSGPEALETARAFRPEVVLCDLGLPGMSGYEVGAALRRDPATTAIRLIAVSGYGHEEDQRRSRAAGFEVHLTKPLDIEELRRLLAVTAEPGRV